MEFSIGQSDFARRIQDTEKSIMEKSLKLDLDHNKVRDELELAKDQISRNTAEL